MDLFQLALLLLKVGVSKVQQHRVDQVARGGALVKGFRLINQTLGAVNLTLGLQGSVLDREWGDQACTPKFEATPLKLNGEKTEIQN